VIPVIETERLCMRGHVVSDFDAMAAMWSDPHVTRFIGGKPATREESWARMMRYVGHWALLGYGFWLIEEKATGRFVGEAGFADFKREMEPRFNAPEQGWGLAPWAHGQGFATEAIGAQLRWAESHFGRVPFVCMIAPENAPSIRLAEKHGYREVGRSSYKGEASILFRREPGGEA
jgi:RimJ/RimL family protein N-acetyltransferase